jgi:hypothetical protein
MQRITRIIELLQNMQQLTRTIAIALLLALTGCTVITVKATLPDGTVIDADYRVCLQDRKWTYNPETGAITLGANNEPVVIITETIAPMLAKGAAGGI